MPRLSSSETSTSRPSARLRAYAFVNVWDTLPWYIGDSPSGRGGRQSSGRSPLH